MPTCSEVGLYIIALVLGTCCLFGYNSFLASPSYMAHYFQYAAVKSNHDVRTLPKAKMPRFWDDVATWVMLIMLIPMFICQILMLTPCLLRMNLQVRMIGASIALIISMLLVPVCAAGGGVGEGGSIAVLVISGALAGFSTTFLQSSLYALFGTLPGNFMGGFVLGGGFSGSINSVLRIIITAASPSTFAGIKTAAVIFFSIGMGLMVVTIILVIVLRFNSIVHHYCTAYQIGHRPDETNSEMSNHEEHEADAMKVDEGQALDRYKMDNGEDTLQPGDAIEPAQEEDSEYVKDASAWGVIKKIWWMMLMLGITMMTTLTLFPGIGLHAMHTSSSSDSTNDKDKTEWEPESLMPIVIILMYNVGDTIGRLISNFPVLWIGPKVIPWVVIARVIVCTIPLALGACPAKIINSNANPIVIFLVLGLTNGYLIGITMAYGSGDKRLKSEAEKGTAGTVMCFSLLTGMTIGTVVSVIVVTCALE